MRRKYFALVAVLFLIVVAIYTISAGGDEYDDAFGSADEWREYLGGPDRNHYSRLDQINVQNVHKLVKVWEYRTGDSGETQVNSIIINKTLYGTTAASEVFALNAATGGEIWRFAPEEKKSYLKTRGVTYWTDGAEERVFSTHSEWLWCLDAKTGKPISTFGENGRVTLRAGLDEISATRYVMSRTPGTIFEDLLIMPLVTMESAGAAPAYIQAFNVRTGKVEWVFYTIPRKGELGYDTWPEDVINAGIVGGANNWAGMAIDRERGILYAPTGSAAPDFFGGSRKGQNLFANTLLALDAGTGKRIWHYQIVHHDTWDRDLPSPPNLITLTKNGKRVDAVAQVTKSGHVFVFDRVTGEPFHPIEERPVPGSDVSEEEMWATQPFPVIPKPFARQQITENDLNKDSKDYDSLLKLFRGLRTGPYMPLDEKPTMVFPGLDGGAEYGGPAVDPDGIMYVNSNEIPWVLQITKGTTTTAPVGAGEKLYLTHCSSCHKADRSGNPDSGYPALHKIGERMNDHALIDIVKKGRGMMTGFPQISSKDMANLLNYLHDRETEKTTSIEKQPLEPWKLLGYKKFFDSEGIPGITPPWGVFTAIDLNTGEFKWQIPLGSVDAFSSEGSAPTGIENYGGPVVTAGGVLLIAATKDKKMRAFNKENGELLWETELPYAAFSTPSTYKVNGKQYVVVACGGTKGTQKGDAYVAFALP